MSLFWKKDEVWMKGFESGFSKAWDVMTPYIQESISRAEKEIRNQAFNDIVKDIRDARKTP